MTKIFPHVTAPCILEAVFPACSFQWRALKIVAANVAAVPKAHPTSTSTESDRAIRLPHKRPGLGSPEGSIEQGVEAVEHRGNERMQTLPLSISDISDGVGYLLALKVKPPPKGVAESTPFRHSPVYAGWHTDAALPFPWSTDWADWEGLYLFEEHIDGKLKIEKVSTEVFNIPGTVQPVAYMVETGIDVWAFTADKGEFASPKEYLALLLKGGMLPTRRERGGRKDDTIQQGFTL
ncbi:hypothetical protein DFH09DRAFT_1069617 [Mycena vulgaris]|nr:hypothetical protein DFH09DRAFT_1069617 [Mycena vulgaris]